MYISEQPKEVNMKTSQPNKAILLIIVMIFTVIQFSCNSRLPLPTTTAQSPNNNLPEVIPPTASPTETQIIPTPSPTFALTLNGRLQGILAFIRNDNLWVSINGVESQLTTDAISTELPYYTGLPQLWYSNPQISPNATKVAYLKNTSDVSTYSYTRALMVSDIEGKNARQIVGDVAWTLPVVEWSKDSQRIYYLVSNGNDVTTGFETMAVKSVNSTTGDIVEHGHFSRRSGCGGGSDDIADHVSGGESIGNLGKGMIFALSLQNNYVIHAISCSNGLGVLDLSTNQDIILDDGNVSAAAISADGLKIAAISGNNIVIFGANGGNQTFPTAELPRALLWDHNGTAIFYSTSKPIGTRDLDEPAALEVYNNSPKTITLNLSTLWKISLDNGESIKIIDMDTHDLKPIFVTDQKMLVAAIENASMYFDYLAQVNRENLAENYPSVNLIEIDLASLTSNIIMHKTTQADYISMK
jgi:hypothetical protein